MADDNKQIICNVWHLTDEELPPENENLLIRIGGELHFGHAAVYGRSYEPRQITWFCEEGEGGYYGESGPSEYHGRGTLWMLPAPPPPELLDKVDKILKQSSSPWGHQVHVPDPALAGFVYNPDTCTWEKPPS